MNQSLDLSRLSAAIGVEGRLLPLDGGGWRPRGSETILRAHGVRQERARYVDDEIGLRVIVARESFPDSPVVRQWVEVENLGGRTVRVDRLDSVRMPASLHGWEVHSFSSGWGAEFEPARQRLEGGDLVLETRAGRSSQGMHPFAAAGDGRQRLTLTVAWSGNWIIRFQAEGQDYVLSAGLNHWQFHKDLAPGERVVSPPVVLALTDDDVNAASNALARWGRRHLYPANTLSRALPVEWNHWWPYEDVAIDEETFRRNVDQAAEMGLEVATLDAGWFGDPEGQWYRKRGDWHLVNRRRFPSGIPALSDYVHAKGLKFGIWCEIEAVGADAHLAETHPEYLALRDGQRLGYLCFGNPAVRDWAYGILERLIVEYGADWIKLDFNLDPGAGCNRTDHGHGPGDGLFEHYLGYYRVLERVRRNHPEVILENCSSGGLRIDLGILERTQMTFLSDPDWPVHDLQLFWGATCMVAPSACLHWPWSEWRANQDRVPEQTFNPADPGLTRTALDYYTRMSMLNWLGYSLRLPDAPEWVRERLATHARLYQTRVRRFVREADLYKLCGQPLRDGGGDRWQGFLYVAPGAQEGALFVFRLPGGGERRRLALTGLIADRVYTIEDVDSGRAWQATGGDLMEAGLLFDDLPEEGSALLLLS